MQPDRANAAAPWRSAATEDLRVARLLQAESPSTPAIHASEAAEKGLEAGPIVRAHLRVLERFSARTRYPDALGGIDSKRVFVADDAIDAVWRAEAVHAFVDGTIARALPR